MKRQDRRLKKLEQSYNLNDEPLRIIIQRKILGQLDPDDIKEVVISPDGSEIITEKGQGCEVILKG